MRSYGLLADIVAARFFEHGVRQRVRLFLLVTTLLLSALTVFDAGPAWAQSGAAEAQKLLVEGEKAAQAGDWKAALAAFEKAHAANASGPTAVRIANAKYELGQTVAAYEAYDDVLKSYATKIFATEKKKAEERFAELDGKTGTLSIRVSEKDAVVRVDAEVVGNSPVPARIRVTSGEHEVNVTKSGFTPFMKSVDVPGKGNAVLDVLLDKVATMGQIEVKEANGKEIRVLIDGLDVGPAPYTGPLEPGQHDVGGISPNLEAPAQTIEVKGGETTTVTLVSGARTGTLEVRITGEQGTVFVDDEQVGEGNFTGDFVAGEHVLRVEREGYETFNKTVEVLAGDVLVETVSLGKAATGDDLSAEEEGVTSFDGYYGGFQLGGHLMPANSGHTISADDGCDTLGASSCDAGLPLGGSLAGYFGYAFAPLGFELFIIGGADVVSPSASFDGSTGSDINPLVAQPARDEDFAIARFGGGGAIRGRALFPFGNFRVTGALGVGFAYRYLIQGRETVAANGAESAVSDDGSGYFTPALSVELGGQYVITGATAITAGISAWLEHAGDGVQTEPKGDIVLLKDGEIPAPQATPAYDMASGTQFYLGPFIGMQFGP